MAEGSAPASAPAADAQQPIFWQDDGEDEFAHIRSRVSRSYIFEERCAAGQVAKEAGNAMLQRGDYEDALAQYDEGLFHVDFDEFQVADLMGEHRKQLADVRVPLLLNSVLCHLKMNPEEQLRRLQVAEKRCEEVLRTDPANVKARFRRAQLHRRAGEYAEAKAALQRLCREDPRDRAFREELASLQRQVKRSQAEVDTFWSSAMQKQQRLARDVEGDEESVGDTHPDRRPCIVDGVGRSGMRPGTGPVADALRISSSSGVLVPVRYAFQGIAMFATAVWGWWSELLWASRADSHASEDTGSAEAAHLP